MDQTATTYRRRLGRRLARLGEPLPLSFDHDRAIDRLDRHNRSDCVEINT